MTNGSYPSFILSSRRLEVAVGYDEEGDLNRAHLEIMDAPNRLQGNITLEVKHAVDLAVLILQELDPERLAPIPFIDLPNGTYLRNTSTGKVVKISSYDPVAHGEYPEDRRLDDANNWVVGPDGSGFIAYNDPKEPVWTILDDDQVEVETKTTWTFKP